ncbi:MAG: hypothetical protein IT473_08490, partial [Lysobacter sp.]|nr:hypothetical protein [Lysobacter sp.]
MNGEDRDPQTPMSAPMPTSAADADAGHASLPPLFWMWRAMDRLMVRLRRVQRRIDVLPATFEILKRMRFPLLFAIAAIFALRTDQGKEVLIKSLDGPLQGLVLV